MLNNKLLICIVVIMACFAFAAQNSFAAQTGATMSPNPMASGIKSGPLPIPGIEGMNDYMKQLVFASRNIEEGDWPMAMQNLLTAEKIHQDDPRLYEMLGIVYDADREPKKAFEYFKKAGNMYFSEGNIVKAWTVLGWLKTFNIHADEVAQFEQKIREKQN